MHRFYENPRRIRSCRMGRCRHRPLHAAPPLDKSGASAIIKPQGHHGMRRPRSNCWYQDKPRNRHFAEWRFLRFTMIVTVNAPICNVIRISLTSSTEVFRGQPPAPHPRLPLGTRGAVGADAHIGPRRMHRFYENPRRIRSCRMGRCRHRPLHAAPPLDKSGASAIIKITQGPATSGFASVS